MITGYIQCQSLGVGDNWDKVREFNGSKCRIQWLSLPEEFSPFKKEKMMKMIF